MNTKQLKHIKKPPHQNKKSRGQLAIFAALIFQTLFVLFAMALNTALVVHDKINLQNSVDLAAYYGAMKQAELLNTVAHINYQIRQSWKLFAWRNRILGSLSKQLRWPLNNKDIEFFPTRGSPMYTVCVAHKNWGPLSGETIAGRREDSVCEAKPRHLPLLTPPSFSGTLLGFAGPLSNLTQNINKTNKAIRKTCNKYGFNSWLFAFSIAVFFQRDQSARKLLIYKIANDIIKAGHDIDHKPIKAGAEKTFKKNLTFINSLSQPSFQHFNSLEGVHPNQWLKDDAFYLLTWYSNMKGAFGNCSLDISLLNSQPHQDVCPGGLANCTWPLVKELTQQLSFVGSPSQICSSPVCKLSAGLYKKNWTVFFGVNAELNYKAQIFLPTPLKMTAYSYAKPFGGRIGPPPNADFLLPSQTPPNPPLPTRGVQVPVPVLAQYDKNHGPNYSRYPGDPYGLRSQTAHFTWRYFLSQPRGLPNKAVRNYLGEPTSNYNDPDILAKNPQARLWELAAVSPDLFDVAYFTILPDYMSTYYHKLKAQFGPLVRNDFGFSARRRHPIYSQTETVWNQLSAQKLRKPFYKIHFLDQILTGWNPPKTKYKSHDDYNAKIHPRTAFPFSHCDKWGHTSSSINKIAGGCIYGGRAGYSVKLIHPCTLPPNLRGKTPWAPPECTDYYE